MKCEEAAEFVSALCDGEKIPRSAAEHIGRCESCRAKLREYTEAGLELRRLACLEPIDAIGAAEWKTIPRRTGTWPRRGWKTMRIPRLVFALLLVVIIVLSSSLVIVWARARTQASVLVLKATPPSGRTVTCALSLGNRKFGVCAGMQPGIMYKFRVLTTERDRIELGVSVGAWNPVSVHEATGGPASIDILQKGVTAMDSLLKGLPEKSYWFRPGEELMIPFPGSGNFVITGALADHMPPIIPSQPADQLEPRPNELRFVSPVLLRRRKVIFDLEGATADAPDESYCIELYAPGEGLFRVSLAPQQEAVEGHVFMSRVYFQIDGQPYTFLLGAPVSRSQLVWILRDSKFVPPQGFGGREFMGTPKLSQQPYQVPTRN